MYSKFSVDYSILSKPRHEVVSKGAIIYWFLKISGFRSPIVLQFFRRLCAYMGKHP